MKRNFLQGHVLDSTKGSGFKLKKSRLILDIMKKFFTMRLPSKMVDVTSLQSSRPANTLPLYL